MSKTMPRLRGFTSYLWPAGMHGSVAMVPTRYGRSCLCARNWRLPFWRSYIERRTRSLVSSVPCEWCARRYGRRSSAGRRSCRSTWSLGHGYSYCRPQRNLGRCSCIRGNWCGRKRKRNHGRFWPCKTAQSRYGNPGSAISSRRAVRRRQSNRSRPASYLYRPYRASLRSTSYPTTHPGRSGSGYLSTQVCIFRSHRYSRRSACRPAYISLFYSLHGGIPAHPGTSLYGNSYLGYRTSAYGFTSNAGFPTRQVHSHL